MLDQKIRKSIDQSVLCWLATASSDNCPNVSPKEIFTCFGDDVIVANIASPQTVRNIRQNDQVCISFIDILVQKGFQLKGTATIVDRSDPAFHEMEKVLEKMTKGKFPFRTITRISISASKEILAPSYLFYPDTTEEQLTENAKKAYGFFRDNTNA